MFQEKNLPKLIILTPIITIIILSTFFIISLVNTQNKYLIKESKQQEIEYINHQKIILKNEIDRVFSYIQYQKNLLLSQAKKEIQIQMNAFSKNLKKDFIDSHTLLKYIYSHGNSNTDFIIYDISKSKTYKHFDVFFELTSSLEYQQLLQNKETTFFLEDNTTLYYIKYFPKKQIIITLKKDIYTQIKDLKNNVARWIEFKRFGKNNYFWINSNQNKLIAHPYKQELIGKDQTNITDSLGEVPLIQKFLHLAVKSNEGAYYTYHWNKPLKNVPTKKLSFIRYNEDWQWVIGAGIYLDEINQTLTSKKKLLKTRLNSYINSTIQITIVLIIITLLISITIAKKISNALQDYQKKVKEEQKNLKKLNDSLNQRIEYSIQEVQEKDRAMIHQAKLARMGEMLNMISHQWRQPLSQLSGVIMEMETTISFKQSDEKFILKNLKDITKIIQFMSHTIEDFKNFFKPQKAPTEFLISKACQEAIYLIQDSLNNQNIKLEYQLRKDSKINGFQRDYSQVILNILVNAKDALVMNNIKDGRIIITIDQENNQSILTVQDNAQGIILKNIEQVFEPYFSTKKAQGTGLGLYMSKMIIEKNMNGQLSVKNIKNGALFKIII